MSKLQQLVQAERDGTLTARDEALLNEARKRGLIKPPKDSVADAVAAVAKQGHDLHALHAEMVKQIASAIRDAKPVVNMPEPVINVEAVLEPAKSEVHVLSGAKKWTMTVNRDRYGNISSITAEAE